MFTVEWSCRQEKSKICTLGVSPSKCKYYSAVNKALDAHKSYCAVVLAEYGIMIDFDWTEVYDYIECKTDGESAISAPLPRSAASNSSHHGRKLFETNNVSEI